jgi:hypothetical protein
VPVVWLSSILKFEPNIGSGSTILQVIFLVIEFQLMSSMKYSVLLPSEKSMLAGSIKLGPKI